MIWTSPSRRSTATPTLCSCEQFADQAIVVGVQLI